MNSLNRNIEVGEIVVLDKEHLRPEYHALEERLFVCEGGFGMSASTSGRAIYGKFLSDAEYCREDSTHISREETIEYQATHKSNVNDV